MQCVDISAGSASDLTHFVTLVTKRSIMTERAAATVVFLRFASDYCSDTRHLICTIYSLAQLSELCCKQN